MEHRIPDDSGSGGGGGQRDDFQQQSESLTNKQEKNEQSQFSHGGFQSASENLQPLGMSG